ncbi:hypothetical protein NicSoilB4_07730 [Arthrobacter sp. NicSoilB4]|nr:hypothetical protein NicSoilB4_07730 [Arthrobacter sp. NicSoilB4]
MVNEAVRRQFINEGEVAALHHIPIKPLNQSNIFSHFRLLAGTRPIWIPQTFGARHGLPPPDVPHFVGWRRALGSSVKGSWVGRYAPR